MPTFAADDIQPLRLQRERERALRDEMERRPDIRAQETQAPDFRRLPEREAPCFPIQRITLRGDDAEQFQWALAAADPADDPATGRCLGAQGIALILHRIQNALIDRGYVTTRVLAQSQGLRGGVLETTLMPGRVRAIRAAESVGTRATFANAIPLRPGDILSLRDLEQGLENLKRIPTADAGFRIEPGTLPGESDIVVDWRQTFPLRLTLGADDAGARATGKYQGSVTLSYDHALTLNDLFYVSFNHDLGGGDAGMRGTLGHTVHYSLPYGYWLLSLTASRSRYHQSVAGISQAYLYSGESENQEIRLARLIHRDADSKTSVALRGWLRTSNNYIDDTEVETQRRRMAGWEIGVDHRAYLGASTLDLEAAYRWGTGALGSLPAPEEPFGEGTSRPRIYTAGARLSVPFNAGGRAWQYTGALRAQWNDTPLVPLDRFAIGGRYNVRGFDGENTLSAERGWYLRNEIGTRMGEMEIYAGLDHGQVNGPSAKWLLGKQLTGAVLGLRGAAGPLRYEVFAAKPIDKPAGFQTADTSYGFQLIAEF